MKKEGTDAKASYLWHPLPVWPDVRPRVVPPPDGGKAAKAFRPKVDHVTLSHTTEITFLVYLPPPTYTTPPQSGVLTSCHISYSMEFTHILFRDYVTDPPR